MNIYFFVTSFIKTTNPFTNTVSSAVQFFQPDQLPHGLGQPLQLVVPDLEDLQVGHAADCGGHELEVAVDYVQVGQIGYLRDAVGHPAVKIFHILFIYS